MGKPPFHPEDKVGNYIIDKQVNVGETVAVYTVKNENILIRAPLIDSTGAAIKQFKEKVKLMQQLEHPFIIKILESDLEAEIPWYSIECLEGETLYNLINTKNKNLLEIFKIIYFISDALGYAHSCENPVYHHRLNPHNLYFKENKPVIDFGYASFGSRNKIILSTNDNILYMAPEQLDIRAKTDQRADVYSLGVILYEMINDSLPYGYFDESFNEEERLSIIDKILDDEFKAPDLDIPDYCKKVIEKSLSKNKDERFENAKKMTEEIKVCLEEMFKKEIEEAKGNQEFGKALELSKQSLEYGISSKEDIEKLEKSYVEKTLDFVSSPAIYNFRDMAKKITKLLKLAKTEESFIKDKIKEIYCDILKVDDVNSWHELLIELEDFIDSIIALSPSIPKDSLFNREEHKRKIEILSQELQNTQKLPQQHIIKEIKQFTREDFDNADDDEEKIANQKKLEIDENVEEDESDFQTKEFIPSELICPKGDGLYDDDMPTAIMAPVEVVEKTGDEIIKPDTTLEISNETEEPSLKTSDYVIILEETKKDKEKITKKSTKPELPTGFHWKEDDTIICEKDQSEMIYIPAGKFIMGSESAQAFEVEKPEHEVFISDFFIDRYPVTWKQYLLFCEETGYSKPVLPRWKLEDNHPVVNISFFDAKAYCDWSGKILPAESQWEKAARGGLWLDGDNIQKIKNQFPKRKYPWGNEAPDNEGIWRANYNAEPRYGKNRGKKSTSPVGNFSEGKSPYGCLDMAGNVWEWTRDWYLEDYYKDSPEKDPEGPEESFVKSKEKQIGKVLRGGSWYVGFRLIRVSTRRRRPPEGKGGTCGLRGAGLFGLPKE